MKNVVQGFPVQNYSIRTARYCKCISAVLAKVCVALPCGRNLSSVDITMCDPKFSGWKKLWKSAKTSKKLICGIKSMSPGFAPLTSFSLLSNRLTLHFFFCSLYFKILQFPTMEPGSRLLPENKFCLDLIWVSRSVIDTQYVVINMYVHVCVPTKCILRWCVKYHDTNNTGPHI